MRRAALVVALLLAVRPAGPLQAALGPRYGGALSVGVLELPAALEPRDVLGRDESMVLGLVHETLVRLEADGAVSPGLASRWTSAAEGREWTLWLRTGLRFHDGTSLASGDAARSIRRFLRGASVLAPAFAESLDGGAAFRSGTSEDLPGVAAPAPDRLVLRFGSVRALPIAPLAAPAAAVTGPQGSGAGPFVPNLHVPGRRLALVPFANHWSGRPYLDSIDVVAAASQETLAADFDAGRIDVWSGGGGTYRLASTLLLAVGSRPPFDTLGARQAVDAALERIELPRLLSRADPARVLLPPDLLPPLPSPRRPAGPMRFDAQAALTVEREVPPLVSQRLVALLSELGLRIRVGVSSPSSLPATGLRLFAWSPQVPEAGLALLEIAARAGVSGDLLDSLSAAALEPDADRRRARLHRAEEALRESCLVLSLGLAPVSAAARGGVHGVAVDVSGRLRLEDAWVEP